MSELRFAFWACSFPLEVEPLLLFGHFISRDDPRLVAPLGVENRQQSLRFGAPKTKHPLFVFVLLNTGFQGLDQDRLFSFFWSDAVPPDVLPVLGVPIELHALHGTYDVSLSQGAGHRRRLRFGFARAYSSKFWRGEALLLLKGFAYSKQSA